LPAGANVSSSALRRICEEMGRGKSSRRNTFLYEGGFAMDSTTIIRVVAGVLFVIVLVILIQRRRTRIK
jgi:hypothetical protein